METAENETRPYPTLSERDIERAEEEGKELPPIFWRKQGLKKHLYAALPIDNLPEKLKERLHPHKRTFRPSVIVELIDKEQLEEKVLEPLGQILVNQREQMNIEAKEVRIPVTLYLALVCSITHHYGDSLSSVNYLGEWFWRVGKAGNITFIPYVGETRLYSGELLVAAFVAANEEDVRARNEKKASGDGIGDIIEKMKALAEALKDDQGMPSESLLKAAEEAAEQACDCPSCKAKRRLQKQEQMIH